MIFYRLECIPLIKHHFQHKFDVIYDINKKKIYSGDEFFQKFRIQRKNKTNPLINSFNYFSMKYQNSLPEKCDNILNYNLNSVKMASIAII